MNTAEVVSRLRNAMIESVAASVKTRMGMSEDVRGLNTAIALFLTPEGNLGRRNQIWMDLDKFARRLWNALDEAQFSEPTPEDNAPGAGYKLEPVDMLEIMTQGHDLHDLIF